MTSTLADKIGLEYKVAVIKRFSVKSWTGWQYVIINENEEGSPSGRSKPKMRYILITRKYTNPTFWLRKKANKQKPNSHNKRPKPVTTEPGKDLS